MNKPVFDSDNPAKPSQVILYMLEEATRRTDLNSKGEFGVLPDGTIWHHTALADRIDDYVNRLVEESAHDK